MLVGVTYMALEGARNDTRKGSQRFKADRQFFILIVRLWRLSFVEGAKGVFSECSVGVNLQGTRCW